MKQCHKQVSDCRPKPSPMDMTEVTSTYTELCGKDHTLNNQIVNVNYISTPFEASVLSEEEIQSAVAHLKRWKAS
jgi:hypothetical protein